MMAAARRHASRHVLGLLTCGLSLGVFRFLWFAERHGTTYDFQSFQLVARLADDGANVYAETERYNYGPIWQLVLWGLVQLTSPESDAFRATIIAILTIADISVAIALGYLVSWTAAWLFLASPISMVISGFHLQFDNVAMAIAMGAVLATRSATTCVTPGRSTVREVMMSLSLMMKHVLLLLPIWRAMSARSLRQRLLRLSPIALFAIAFIPWIASERGRRGVLEHVFMYQGGREIPVLGVLGESLEERWPLIGLSLGACLVLVLLVTGWVLRDRDDVSLVFLYLLSAYALSPGASNQQLVILTIALLGLRSVAAIPVMLYGWLFLTIHPDGLHATSDPESWLSTPALSGVFDTMIALEYSPFIVTALVVLIIELRRGAAGVVRGA